MLNNLDLSKGAVLLVNLRLLQLHNLFADLRGYSIQLKKRLDVSEVRVPPLFQHWFSMPFPWPKKWKSMTYRHNICFQVNDIRLLILSLLIPELAVTVPSARSTNVEKIKRFIIWLYKWSRVTFTELLSAVVKIPWHYHHFPW